MKPTKWNGPLHIHYNYMHKISLQLQHCIWVLPFAINIPLACFQPGHSASGKRKSAGPGPRIPFWSLILGSTRGGSVCPSFSSSLQPGAGQSLYNIKRKINELLKKIENIMRVKRRKWSFLLEKRKSYKEGPSWKEALRVHHHNKIEATTTFASYFKKKLLLPYNWLCLINDALIIVFANVRNTCLIMSVTCVLQYRGHYWGSNIWVWFLKYKRGVKTCERKMPNNLLVNCWTGQVANDKW